MLKIFSIFNEIYMARARNNRVSGLKTRDNALFPNRSRTPYACGCHVWCVQRTRMQAY